MRPEYKTEVALSKELLMGIPETSMCKFTKTDMSRD